MLSVVTISFNDIDGLLRTIESVKKQDSFDMIGRVFEHTLVVSGVSCADLEKVKSIYNYDGVHFMFNKDTGLYNAMNLGAAYASGTHILFLNGGDEFCSEDSLDKVSQNVFEGEISLFRVMQYYDEVSFIRPGRDTSQNRQRYSHQGFVAPLTTVTPKYDEVKKINADTFWMRECLSLYPVREHLDIIARFELGGVSNRPSPRTIWLRLVTNGLTSATKELTKFLLFKAIGAKRYYTMMAHYAGYDHIEL